LLDIVLLVLPWLEFRVSTETILVELFIFIFLDVVLDGRMVVGFFTKLTD